MPGDGTRGDGGSSGIVCSQGQDVTLPPQVVDDGHQRRIVPLSHHCLTREVIREAIFVVAVGGGTSMCVGGWNPIIV